MAGVAAGPAAEQDRPKNRKPRRPGAQSPAPVPTARRRSQAGRSRRRHPTRVPLAAARSGPARRSPFAVARPRTPRGPSGLADFRCSTRSLLTWPRCYLGPGSPAARTAEDTQARSGPCANTPAPGHTWKPGPAAEGSPGSRRGGGGARAPGLPSRFWVAE